MNDYTFTFFRKLLRITFFKSTGKKKKATTKIHLNKSKVISCPCSRMYVEALNLVILITMPASL